MYSIASLMRKKIHIRHVEYCIKFMTILFVDITIM